MCCIQRDKIKYQLFAFFGICLILVLSYSPNVTGEFILSDKPLLEKNPYITQLHSITSYLFQEDGATITNPGSQHTGYYRPLIYITYWIDYKIYGMNASGYRTTNLILHVLTCFVLFRFISFVTHDPLSSLWATVIFALHPIHSESVSYIITRNNILVSFFGLLTLLFYIKAFRDKKRLYLFVSFVSFTCAILSKEFGLTLLPILVIYHRLLPLEKRNIQKEIGTYIPFALICVFYFLLRKSVTSAVLTPALIDQFWHNILYVPYLIVYNVRLILLPFGLHSFIVHYPNSYISWFAIGAYFIVIGIGIFTWHVKNNKIVCFGLLSFFIALTPVLNIIPTSSASLITMRWLYFPSMFLALALSFYLSKLLRKKLLLTHISLGIITLYCATYTYTLNKYLWHDDATFFQQEVERFRNDYYSIGLAGVLLEKKQYHEAEPYFRMVIDQGSRSYEDFINFSALLIETDRPLEAIEYLNKGKKLPTTMVRYGDWHNNMGMALFKLRQYKDALPYFKKAVVYNPENPQFWSNLGGCYGVLGDYPNSVLALKQGITLESTSLSMRLNLAITYMNMHDYDNVLSVLSFILEKERSGNKIIESMIKQAIQGRVAKKTGIVNQE